MFMVVAMESPWMVDLFFRFGNRQIHFFLCYECPACLGDDPEGSDAVIAGEMVALWHIFVTKVDVNAGVAFCVAQKGPMDAV
jgi:hypothetical protein